MAMVSDCSSGAGTWMFTWWTRDRPDVCGAPEWGCVHLAPPMMASWSHEQPACPICQGHTCRLGTRRTGSRAHKEEQAEGTSWGEGVAVPVTARSPHLVSRDRTRTRLTSNSSIILRIPLPFCPMMYRWRSKGTSTSVVTGTRACGEEGRHQA